MLLETKEVDFGCQFVLTVCKVCFEAEEAVYRPESGCALFWLFQQAWLGADGGPHSEVMRSQILVPFASESPAHGASGWEKKSLE